MKTNHIPRYNRNMPIGAVIICSLEALGLLLAALKVLKIINWSWWLVLLPMYLPILIIGLTVITLFIYAYVILKMEGNTYDGNN